MTNSSGVFLSILIPTWNRYESVLEAVKSVAPVTEETEVIVVDDGSEEPIAQRLRDGLRLVPHVKVFRNAVNLGMVRNWNACISHASGEWMGILCDDDCYNEGAIERAVSIMKRTSEPSLILQDPSLNMPMQRCAPGRETVRTLKLPIVSGNFWHKKIVEKLGGFNERFIYSADAEYWPRIAAHFPVLKIKTAFSVYKRHKTNYMWTTWRRPDFLEQAGTLTRAVASLSQKDNKAIEEELDAGLWGTLLTIIESTFLERERSDIFSRYFPEALNRARGFKRKIGLIKSLLLGAALRTKGFLRHSSEELPHDH